MGVVYKGGGRRHVGKVGMYCKSSCGSETEVAEREWAREERMERAR